MKYYYFEERIFGGNMDLIINCSQTECEKFFRKKLKENTLELKIKNEYEGCHCVLIKGMIIRRIIWLEKFDWSVKSQGLLTHELSHFIFQLMEDNGIPISKENDEVFAYLMSYYVTNLFWKLRVLNPRHKKYDKKILSSVRRKRTTKK